MTELTLPKTPRSKECKKAGCKKSEYDCYFGEYCPLEKIKTQEATQLAEVVR